MPIDAQASKNEKNLAALGYSLEEATNLPAYIISLVKW